MTENQTHESKIIADALTAAEAAAKIPNYIYVDIVDPDTVCLTTVIQGEPLAWIEYDGKKLDGLIALLTKYRGKIT